MPKVYYSLSIGTLITSLVLIGLVFSESVAYSFVVFNNSLIEMGLYMDYIVLDLILMLVICSAISLPFCLHYMGGTYPLNYYLLTMLSVFVSIMVVLILCSSPLNTLIMWEFLGLSSFLLILFSRTMLSSRAALITAITSRIGDVSLVLYVCYCSSCFSGYNLLGVLLFLCIITKSAIYPFITWLIQAMRAPTPVSCLVHSSTLVAAGVWMGLRYNAEISSSMGTMLVLFSIITIIFTALASLIIVDLKQVVALSTCNNISWCILSLGLGNIEACSAMLVSHGIMKCVLFVMVGDVFSGSDHSQSGVNVLGLEKTGNTPINSFVTLILSLGGFPALGIFITKHLIISSGIMSWNIVFINIVVLCVVLTFGYSFRLVLILCGPSLGLSGFYLKSFLIASLTSFVPSFINQLLVNTTPHKDFIEWDGWMLFSGLILLGEALGMFIGYISYSYDLSKFAPSSWVLSFFSCSELISHLVFLNWLNLVEFMGLSIFQWEVWSLNKTRISIEGLSLHFLKYGNNINILVLGLILFVMVYVLTT